jgi:general stress protein 26
MAEETPNAEPGDVARVWRLMKKIKICMLASHDGEKIRARPMAAHPREDANVVFFLTDVRGHKDEELARDDTVCLSFARPEDGKFLVVTGHAAIVDDRTLISDLWDNDAAPFWQGPDDPNVRVICVTPHDAQFWEGPHGFAATVAMVFAAATAGPPVLGDQRKVNLN